MSDEFHRGLLDLLIRWSPLPVVTDRTKFPFRAGERGWYTDGVTLYLDIDPASGWLPDEETAVATFFYLLGVARMFFPDGLDERFFGDRIKHGSVASLSARFFAARVLSRCNLVGSEEAIRELGTFEGEYARIDWTRIEQEAADVTEGLAKALHGAWSSSTPTVDAWAGFPVEGVAARRRTDESKAGYSEYEWVGEEIRSKGVAWERALVGLPDFQVVDHIPVLDYESSKSSASQTPIRALYLLRSGRVVLGKALHVQASTRARAGPSESPWPKRQSSTSSSPIRPAAISGGWSRCSRAI